MNLGTCLDGIVRPRDGDDIAVLARIAVANKVMPGARGELLQGSASGGVGRWGASLRTVTSATSESFPNSAFAWWTRPSIKTPGRGETAMVQWRIDQDPCRCSQCMWSLVRLSDVQPRQSALQLPAGHSTARAPAPAAIQRQLPPYTTPGKCPATPKPSGAPPEATAQRPPSSHHPRKTIKSLTIPALAQSQTSTDGIWFTIPIPRCKHHRRRRRPTWPATRASACRGHACPAACARRAAICEHCAPHCPALPEH